MPDHVATVGDLFDAVNSHWPFSAAEEWDRVGLVVGSRRDAVTRVLMVVDVTDATVREAIDGGYDAVLAHHPLLLRGVTTLDEDLSKGSLVATLIRGGCALIAAHTNADVPDLGVATVFAEQLGLRDTQPIHASAADDSIGIGRVGVLSAPCSVSELAQRVAALLPPTVSGVRVAGSPDAEVRRVAICPGAGDSLLEHPLVAAADAYITADLRHHPASESRDASAARDGGPALLDVSHWASESLWLDEAAAILSRDMPSVQFVVSRICTDPWNFSVGAHTALSK